MSSDVTPLALHDSPDVTMARIEIDRIRGVGPWADTAETTVAESV